MLKHRKTNAQTKKEHGLGAVQISGQRIGEKKEEKEKVWIKKNTVRERFSSTFLKKRLSKNRVLFRKFNNTDLRKNEKEKVWIKKNTVWGRFKYPDQECNINLIPL